MRKEAIIVGFLEIVLTTGCAVNQAPPAKAAQPREEMVIRTGYILDRVPFSDGEYELARQEELKRKSLDDETVRSGEKLNEWASNAPVPIIIPILFAFVQPDSTQEMAYPQRYKFTVRLDSGQLLQIVDTYPFEALQCAKVGTGVVTGKLTLLSGNKGECISNH